MKVKKKPNLEKERAELERITDFTLVNSLVSLGHEILSINLSKENSQKNEFVFDKNEAVTRLVPAYFAKNLLVEPKKFMETRKEIHVQLRKLQDQLVNIK